MKRSYSTLFLLCLFVFVAMSFGLRAQQVFKTTSSSVIGYLEYLPDGYHNTSKPYPVVIFLHGRGEKGPNTKDRAVLSRGISSVTKLGPPYYVKKGTDFPFILISPQLKSGHGDWPLWYIMEVVNHVKKTLRVDQNRIYLTGLSLGGGGVWKAAEDHPEVFAAVAPICGSWNTISKAKRIADQNLPVWAFHGNKDNVVPWSRTQRMVDAINHHRPNPRAKLTTYNGVRHDAWARAYRPDHSSHNPNVYEWLMSHTKKGSSQQQQQQQEEQKANQLPVVSAGSDRVLTAGTRSVELVASASDPDGKIEKYQWQQVYGGGVSMSRATTARLLLNNPAKGTYEFRVTVTDNDGGTRSDNVRVQVKEASGPALRAIAGPERYLRLPVNNYTLAGGATSRDGNIVSYQWRQVDGPALQMSGANGRVLKIYNVKTPGKRTLLLTVRDSKGRVASDHVRLYFQGQSTHSSSVSDAEVVGDPALTEQTAYSGDQSDSRNWVNAPVTIYNDRGERVFSGKWDERNREQVFREKGLYIYKVNNPARPASGKVFIQ